jgi:hypothetical protein
MQCSMVCSMAVNPVMMCIVRLAGVPDILFQLYSLHTSLAPSAAATPAARCSGSHCSSEARLPRRATHLLLWGADFRNGKLEFWQEVYGVNMKAMKESVISTAHLGTVKADKVVTSAATLLELTLAETHVQQTEFTVPFELTALHDCTLSALVAYFDVDFCAGAARARCAAPCCAAAGAWWLLRCPMMAGCVGLACLLPCCVIHLGHS